MKRWEDNPRRRTPDDHGGCGETSGPDERPPTDRRVMRGDGLRMETPEDYGGRTEAKYITIRKLRLSDGVEVWNNGRGNRRGDLPDVNAPDPQEDAACRAIIHEGGDGFVTFGTPVTGAYYGSIVRWRDGGNSALRGTKSATATDGAFDADYLSTGIYPHFACESNGRYWLAGTADVDGVRRHYVQSYNTTTLAGVTTTLLPMVGNGVDAHEPSVIRQIAAYDDGVVVMRTDNELASFYSPRYDYIGCSFVNAAGSIATSVDSYRQMFGSVSSIGSNMAGTSLRWMWGALNLSGPPLYSIGGRVFAAVLPIGEAYMRLYSFGSAGTVSDHGELAQMPQWRATDNPPYDVDDVGTQAHAYNVRFFSGGGEIAVHGSSQRSSSGYVVNVYDDAGAFVRTLTNCGAPIGMDNAGSIFGTFTSFGTTYLARTDGSSVAWTVAYPLYTFGTQKIITSGGFHYLIGVARVFGGDTNNVMCINATTGVMAWQVRHHSDDGDELLLDGYISGDYLYVCGEASTYEP